MTILHVYIHNWPLQTFIQDYGLASHSTYVVCVNFIHEQRVLQLNVDSERKIIEKLFHGRFITLKCLPEICLDKIAEEIFFLYFVLSNKPTY